MITRADVADLQPGDVVRIVESYEDGSRYVHEGPVRADGGNALMFGDLWLRTGKGDAPEWVDELTVVSRAPRPLYVNHPRTEPMPGDVAIDADWDGSFAYGDLWGCCTEHLWVAVGGTKEAGRDGLPARLRLLVDGETGRCVP